MEYKKVKSSAKIINVKGEALTKLVLDTLGTISSIVGATLGPGGRGVLIERYEHNLPPTVTKDGVTTMRALGFTDPTKHVILEAARDAAVRTASEAGDGTTTATVLADAIVKNINRYCSSNPRVSPQRVVRLLEKTFLEVIEPAIRKEAIKVDFSTPEKRELSRKLMHSVAKVSANGDVALADAVMECFEITGDEGNVTLIEQSGPSKYEVEEIRGYGVGVGYEESCGRMWSKFVNDPATQRCTMENPVFLIYNGKITEIQTIQLLMERIGNAWQQGLYKHHNVVVVASGFSDTVLGILGINFAERTSINVYPLTVPQSPIPGGQLGLVEDLCAITGAKLFDPLNYPCDRGELQDLGPGVELFEASRYRSNIVGHATGPVILGYELLQDERGVQRSEPAFDTMLYEDLLMVRVDEVKVQVDNAVSQLDKMMLEERVAKLAGGIARLKVIGASNGETKEKRDRAEDAVCAVRGAIKHGALPGGGWMLARLTKLVEDMDNEILSSVLAPALELPIYRLLENAGMTREEIEAGPLDGMYLKIEYGENPNVSASDKYKVYDASAHEWVDALEDGLLDSVPAVLEAVRNSISIAALLGTLGGCVVFARDDLLERGEADNTAEFLRNANVNEADLRS